MSLVYARMGYRRYRVYRARRPFVPRTDCDTAMAAYVSEQNWVVIEDPEEAEYPEEAEGRAAGIPDASGRNGLVQMAESLALELTVRRRARAHEVVCIFECVADGAAEEHTVDP